MRLDLPDDKRARLMQAWFELQAWPDVPASLRALRASGLRIGLLSNVTEAILRRGLHNDRCCN